MSDRSDRIRLNPAISRCEPLNGSCTMKSRCARAQAQIPTGTPLEDFTAGQPGGGTAGCVGLIFLADVHTDAPKPRATKPPIRGIA
jgi:hypothetical protein